MERARAAAAILTDRLATLARVRIAVHTDFEYHDAEDGIRGEHAFTLFFVALAEHVDSLVLLGRLDPTRGRGRYPLTDRVQFVPLPYYSSLVHLRESVVAMFAATRRFRRVLDEVDAVWLLGPHPMQIAFAVMAKLRGKRVVLGVRQDFPRYIASRHPRRPLVRLAAIGLEGVWRLIARRSDVIVVGPELASRYRHSQRVLEITASLVSDGDLVDPAAVSRRDYDGPLTALSVGRIEAEKNPLLLADALAGLRKADQRWRLVVVGEGPMLGELEARLTLLGVDDAAELCGYVPFGETLLGLYRSSHALLHVSWTEGLPQVLIEAFAAALPVVATDVGGIRAAVGDAALLMPAGDATAAVHRLLEVAGDAELRLRLAESGAAWVANRTIEAESERVALFIGRNPPTA